ncbi:hypothetical protein ACIBUY_30505 [Streptomyces sp. NPDC050085]|uniref:hypothetical protein n=1 Tax=Streptomyces sp. NPDC050085 TaxID=3365600 RepID=UPI0037B3D009
MLTTTVIVLLALDEADAAPCWSVPASTRTLVGDPAAATNSLGLALARHRGEGARVGAERFEAAGPRLLQVHVFRGELLDHGLRDGPVAHAPGREPVAGGGLGDVCGDAEGGRGHQGPSDPTPGASLHGALPTPPTAASSR